MNSKTFAVVFLLLTAWIGYSAISKHACGSNETTLLVGGGLISGYFIANMKKK